MTPELAAMRFVWFKMGGDGVPELYADNQMLSTLRMCERKFMLEHIHNIKPRGRAWQLEFGQWFHSSMEIFYGDVKKERKLTEEWLNKRWIPLSEVLWREMDMEHFAPGSKGFDKRYETLGGLAGAKALLLHYWIFFGNGYERLRVVGTEIPFGRNKEVPIIGSAEEFSYAPFRAYLTGRVDLLIDDGTRISPLDHKTTSRFSGKEASHFNPNDGPCGYIYSVRCLMDTLYPQLKAEGRLCDSIWINHVSLAVSKERFKRSRLTKSVDQLESFRLRMVGSFVRLWNLIINEVPATWNTGVCTNQYHSACPFLALDEQDADSQKAIFDMYYEVREPWNPYRS